MVSSISSVSHSGLKEYLILLFFCPTLGIFTPFFDQVQHIPVSLPLCCCRVEYTGSVERAVTRLSSTTCILSACQSAAGRVTKNAGYACGRQGACTTALCELSVGLTICLPPATRPTALTAPWSRPACRKWGDNSQPAKLDPQGPL